jgi:hypothetical protein
VQGTKSRVSGNHSPHLKTNNPDWNRALVMFHVPPGINTYDGKPTWNEKYAVYYQTLCESYKDVILIQLAAHYHTDQILLVGDTGLLLNPSVSPVHTNNPSFRRFIVDDNGELANYEQMFLDLTKANSLTTLGKPVSFETEYDWLSTYPSVQGVNGEAVYQAVLQIAHSAQSYMTYLTHQYTLYPKTRGPAVCSMTNQISSDYNECVDHFEDDEE